jgi:hypothetical protein
MDAFYHAKNEPQKRGKDAIIDFTNWVAMALSGWTAEIQRHAPKTGAAGYNELCIQRSKQQEARRTPA